MVVVGKLSFQQIAMFTTAGLLIDPGIAGQIQQSQQITNNRAEEIHFVSWQRHALSIPRDAPTPNVDNIIKVNEIRPVLPVYVLTDVGLAVASILADQQDAALAALCGS